jgi:hypothetical protein
MLHSPVPYPQGPEGVTPRFGRELGLGDRREVTTAAVFDPGGDRSIAFGRLTGAVFGKGTLLPPQMVIAVGSGGDSRFVIPDCMAAR